AGTIATDDKLADKVKQYCQACYTDINDDFNTAKVLANLFELAPIINSIHGGQIAADALSVSTLQLIQNTFQIFMETVLGLQSIAETSTHTLDAVLQLVIDIRNKAKVQKDYVTSDTIRVQLAAAGIVLKDEKDGTVSYVLG